MSTLLTYRDIGDGFGGNGPGGKRVAIDSEGLVLGKDGTFWISDEYGKTLTLGRYADLID
jgi:hypothetical protein